MPLFALLAPILGNLFNTVANKVAPDKMSEEDKAKLQAELQLQVMQMDWQTIQAQYDDRASARSLAAQDIAKGNAFTTAAAALVRPLWGIGAFCLVAFEIISKIPISAAQQDIVNTVLYFYFGGRVIEKVMPHVTEALTRIGGSGNGNNNGS